jgi:hypothetical protein
LAAGLTAAGLIPAQAGLLTWDLSTATGDLGPTSSYNAGGYTITATGFANSTASPPYATTDLYGKAEGAGESGLGIASDPSGDHEIWGHTFIQLDVSAPYAAGLHTYQFEMGSTTDGEAWSVYGADNAATNPGFGPTTLLYSNYTDQLTVHSLSGYDYYFFLYTGPSSGVGGSNVLLYKTFSAVTSVPETSTWAMMGLGFAGLAFAGYRSRRSAAAIA